MISFLILDLFLAFFGLIAIISEHTLIILFLCSLADMASTSDQNFSSTPTQNGEAQRPQSEANHQDLSVFTDDSTRIGSVAQGAQDAINSSLQPQEPSHGSALVDNAQDIEQTLQRNGGTTKSENSAPSQDTSASVQNSSSVQGSPTPAEGTLPPSSHPTKPLEVVNSPSSPAVVGGVVQEPLSSSSVHTLPSHRDQPFPPQESPHHEQVPEQLRESMGGSSTSHSLSSSVENPQPTQDASVAPSSPTPTASHQILTPSLVKVKKGSKISPLQFMIGCGAFGFLMIGAIGFLFYFALQHPEQFEGIIGIEGIKTGLKFFAWFFFGILFLGSFTLLIFNLYKLITQKGTRKFKYILGLALSALLLGGTVAGGIISFNKINEIIQTTGANSNLLIPYTAFKGNNYRKLSEGYPLIAPSAVVYGVNDILLTRFFNNQFAGQGIQKLQLDCGNDRQILNYNAKSQQFNGSCLYMRKGDYPLKFITTLSSANGTSKEVITELGPLHIAAEILLNPNNGKLSYSDDGSEIIIGKAPTKLDIDANSLFSDLKLDQYHIQRDFDGDGTRDRSDSTNFSHQFRKAQLQSVYFNLPDVNNLIYKIDLRVLQSDVPVCTLVAEPLGSSPTRYTISADFDDKQTRINSYMYKIKDLRLNKIIDTLSNVNNSLSYNFKSEGDYAVILEYMTQDAKQGSCESDNFHVGASNFTVDYTFTYQGPDNTLFKSIESLGSGVLHYDSKSNTFSLTSLPVTLRLSINTINPSSPSTQVIVRLDDKIIQTSNGRDYDIKIETTTSHTITVDIEDPVTKASSHLSFPLEITQDDIIGVLKVFPSNVGSSPFSVTLDASTTILTDKSDEIVYFDRDYGDGEIISNSSVGQASHTYVYDENKNNGVYRPRVTIRTRKGKTASFGLEEPISIKKAINTAYITIDSHPAQTANVGDRVNFSVHTDGTPTHIERDFGNDQHIDCNDRSCSSIPISYEKAGNYTIKASITYKDLSTTRVSTELQVRQK